MAQQSLLLQTSSQSVWSMLSRQRVLFWQHDQSIRCLTVPACSNLFSLRTLNRAYPAAVSNSSNMLAAKPVTCPGCECSQSLNR